MAPLGQRMASARTMARGLPIRPTAIEAALHTRYTIDTLRALVRRFPRRRFIWIMGADNLAQFHRWRQWRDIARLVPIAVVVRPGYDAPAHLAPAMGWLRRSVRPEAAAAGWTKWRPPALVILSTRPDPTSATAIRARDPDWHLPIPSAPRRDPVTRRFI